MLLDLICNLSLSKLFETDAHILSSVRLWWEDWYEARKGYNRVQTKGKQPCSVQHKEKTATALCQEWIKLLSLCENMTFYTRCLHKVKIIVLCVLAVKFSSSSESLPTSADGLADSHLCIQLANLIQSKLVTLWPAHSRCFLCKLLWNPPPPQFHLFILCLN